MRSRGARLALAIGLLAVPTGAAATPGSGEMTRTASEGGLNIRLANLSSEPDLAADIVLPEGTTALNVGPISGAAGSCSPNSSQPGIINCFFDPPYGWPGG